MKKHPIPKTANKPCVKCGGHVTVHWQKGVLVRICDSCGFEEPDRG